MNAAIAYSFSRGERSERVGLGDRGQHHVPALQEQRVEDLLLGGEVVVDEAVGDPRLVGDIRHPAGVKALAGEHAHGGVEDHPALVDVARRRRSSSSRARRPSPSVGLGPAVGQRRAAGGGYRAAPRSRGRRRSTASRSGAPAEHEPPRIDDQRAPARAMAARMGADLVRRDHEALVLDRAGPEQHLPVIARRGQRERARDRDDLGARATARIAVQLRKAEVVADAHPEPAAAGQLGDHDLVAGLLVRRTRRTRSPSTSTSNMWILRYTRSHLAVGTDVHARVASFVSPGHALDDRAGDEVDPELRGRSTGPTRSAGPSSGCAPAAICSAVPSTLHFSGSTTSSAPAAAASRTRRSAVARLRSTSSVELSWTAPARTSLTLSSVGRLTSQSDASRTNASATTCGRPLERPYRGAFGARARRGLAALALPPGADARPPGAAAAEGVALRRRLRPGADAVRRRGPDRPARGRRSGRSGTAPSGRLHERTVLGRGRSTLSRRARCRVARPARRDRARARGDRRDRDACARAARSYAWTRKQGGIAAHGIGRRIDGASRAARGPSGDRRHRRVLRAPHALAVVGRRRRPLDGRAVAWNLVDGVNDPPADSERTVWVDGVPSEPPPSFAADLRASTGCASTPRPPGSATRTCSLIRSPTGSRSAPSRELPGCVDWPRATA